MDNEAFKDVVHAFTGPGFVERRWLVDEVHGKLADESKRFVTVVGAPGTGKTRLAASLMDENRYWLRYFAGRDDGGVHAHPSVAEFLKSVGHQFARIYPEAFDVQRLEIIVKQWFGTVEKDAAVFAAKINKIEVTLCHARDRSVHPCPLFPPRSRSTAHCPLPAVQGGMIALVLPVSTYSGGYLPSRVARLRRIPGQR